MQLIEIYIEINTNHFNIAYIHVCTALFSLNLKLLKILFCVLILIVVYHIVHRLHRLNAGYSHRTGIFAIESYKSTLYSKGNVLDSYHYILPGMHYKLLEHTAQWTWALGQ